VRRRRVASIAMAETEKISNAVQEALDRRDNGGETGH